MKHKQQYITQLQFPAIRFTMPQCPGTKPSAGYRCYRGYAQQYSSNQQTAFI